MYVGLRGGRRRSFGASSSKITATCRRLTTRKSSENLTTMVKQCRALFCPSARKSLPTDRPRKGLKHPLIRRNIAGAVGISSLSRPCMYLGFLAMYRGMKSIKPYNSKILFPAHLLKCTCWCQSRVWTRLSYRSMSSWSSAQSTSPSAGGDPMMGGRGLITPRPD
jgi:hypothetical protein